MTHEKEELTVGTVILNMIYFIYLVLWEGKAQTEEELCLGREGVNAVKCL